MTRQNDDFEVTYQDTVNATAKAYEFSENEDKSKEELKITALENEEEVEFDVQNIDTFLVNQDELPETTNNNYTVEVKLTAYEETDVIDVEFVRFV